MWQRFEQLPEAVNAFLIGLAIDVALGVIVAVLLLLLIWKYTAALLQRVSGLYLVIPIIVLVAIIWIT